MKLAANLSWLYNEFEFPDRLKACTEDGFKYAECMFPYEFKARHLRKLAADAGVEWVLINAPAGNWANGDRGLATAISRRDDFKRSVEVAAEYARDLGVKKVHVLAGTVDLSSEHELRTAWACYEENLMWMASTMKNEAIDWLIEPINRHDVPGYLLNNQSEAHELLTRLNQANLGVQMDLYHCQRVEGDALDALGRYLPTGRVKHLQIAGVPERNEPAWDNTWPNNFRPQTNAGLNYSEVCARLKMLSYTGHIGCEYRPKAGTRDGLGWIRGAGFSGTI